MFGRFGDVTAGGRSGATRGVVRSVAPPPPESRAAVTLWGVVVRGCVVGCAVG